MLPLALSPSVMKRWCPLAIVVLGVVEVDAAVAQLAVVQAGLLGALAGELADAAQFLALALALEDLRLQGLAHLGMLVQEVVQLGGR
jgi:hypothetical protein